jgi:hypothetical protein
MNYGLEFDPYDFSGRLVGRFGLSQVPRETIKHVSAPMTRFDNWRSQHFEYQVIGYKVAAPYIIGSFAPDFSVRRYFSAQEFSAGQMCDSIVFCQLGGLGSFASSGRGDQQQSH